MRDERYGTREAMNSNSRREFEHHLLPATRASVRVTKEADRHAGHPRVRLGRDTAMKEGGGTKGGRRWERDRG